MRCEAGTACRRLGGHRAALGFALRLAHSVVLGRQGRRSEGEGWRSAWRRPGVAGRAMGGEGGGGEGEGDGEGVPPLDSPDVSRSKSSDSRGASSRALPTSSSVT